MLNSDLINSSLVDSSNNDLSLNLQSDIIVFNGFSLTGLCSGVENTLVQSSNHRNLAQVNLKTFDYPRIDGSGIIGKKYSKKIIEVSLTLTADTNLEMEDLIDNLKYYTSATNGVLDYKVGIDRRQINCTLTLMEIPNFSVSDNIIQNIKLTFESYDPNAKGVVDSTIGFAGITGNLVEDLVNLGTAKTMATYYLLFQTGNSGITSVSIIVGGFTMSISETISDGDVLIFNGQTYEVTLNGTEVDYTGVFTELEVGENSISFEFTPASTVSVDITCTYPKLYL